MWAACGYIKFPPFNILDVFFPLFPPFPFLPRSSPQIMAVLKTSSALELMKKYDVGGDGKLDKAELGALMEELKALAVRCLSPPHFRVIQTGLPDTPFS